jgi:flagellar hook protein FlgE
MGLFGALFTGVSGLDAQSQALGIISNNIANVNTVGYKGEDAQFSDLVTQINISEQYDPGGVRTTTEQSVTNQGALTQTSSNTDLAVSGDGLFVVTQSPTAYASDQPYYTRAGSFTTDSNGNLQNTAGYYLMGWKLDADGNLPPASDTLSSLTPVNVDSISSILQQTSNMSLSLNVDATETDVYGTGGAPTSTASPDFTRQLSVVDSLGTTQDLNLSMTQNYPNAWTATVSGDAGSNYPYTFGVLFDSSGNIQAAGAIVAGTASSTTTTTSGTVSDTFSSSISGNVLTVTQVDDDGTHKVTTTTPYTYGTTSVAADNTDPVDINLPGMDFGDGSDPTQSITMNIQNMTQYASANNVASISQDGVAYGTKTSISISQDGIVSANFSNGQVVSLYQIPLATFNSENSLQEQSGDVYQQTTGSGTYYLRQPATGGAGELVDSSLENSNVDIATEFSKMIIAQQAYSANTKVISTADQMLSTLLQIQTG